jgi:hypothetical protein
METGDEKSQHDAFPPTRWSLILDAGESDPVARATFCHAY